MINNVFSQQEWLGVSSMCASAQGWMWASVHDCLHVLDSLWWSGDLFEMYLRPQPSLTLQECVSLCAYMCPHIICGQHWPASSPLFSVHLCVNGICQQFYSMYEQGHCGSRRWRWMILVCEGELCIIAGCDANDSQVGSTKQTWLLLVPQSWTLRDTMLQICFPTRSECFIRHCYIQLCMTTKDSIKGRLVLGVLSVVFLFWLCLSVLFWLPSSLIYI